ncbi:glycosyltransferase [Fibrella forsythiae]|uniref:Glycosyltransferase n=1 Tax=Fibrella forsythiae TaxID=2817061 RepID=A0ABS3JNA9_9BACT|nr:glycosyltransferase [Fibrella forsythiae]MBO0951465.1 glycosyltransferase [Fibrella forsythiae]
MIWVLWLVSVAYAVLTSRLLVAWRRLPVLHSADDPITVAPSITVIIPVRNESINLPYLLNDLSAQTYTQFSVIIADDASSDNTAELALSYASTAAFPLTVLSLVDDPTVASPKKRAIAQSISQATGELIVTTDGDCRVGPDWLTTIAHYYGKTGAQLISGPVTFTPDQSVFGSLQTVEFASLIGAGAATLAMGKPTMCNGANLCYQKTAFLAVNGFAGVDHVASGDDELLMHKIATRYPEGVRFLKSQAAIVETAAHSSLGTFYQQRKRWAGKWRAYDSLFPTFLAVFVFLSNLAPLVAVGLWLAGQLSGWQTLTLVMLKVGPEFVYLRAILTFLRKRAAIAWIPLTQLIYPLYVLFFGLAAQQPGITWKGRKLT